MTDREEKALKRINDVWLMETAAIAVGDKPAIGRYQAMKRAIKGTMEDLGYVFEWDREEGYRIVEDVTEQERNALEYWDHVTEMMDDDLREELHSELAPCEPITFLRRYREDHQKRFGEDALEQMGIR